jgi:uncharacterized membrane protein YedE/YeeE
MEIVYAIVLGTLFGFALQKCGAANPQRIIDMLRLRDFHLAKVITFAIGFSSLGLFLLLAAGIIPAEHLSVKSAYVGVIIGGLILGAGWALSGFCPGTGITALGALRRDALWFVLGGLVGAFLYTLVHASLASTFLFDKIAGGKATLAQTEVEKYNALAPSLSPLIVAGGLGLAFIVIAFVLPLRKEKDN